MVDYAIKLAIIIMVVTLNEDILSISGGGFVLILVCSSIIFLKIKKKLQAELTYLATLTFIILCLNNLFIIKENNIWIEPYIFITMSALLLIFIVILTMLNFRVFPIDKIRTTLKDSYDSAVYRQLFPRITVSYSSFLFMTIIICATLIEKVNYIGVCLFFMMVSMFGSFLINSAIPSGYFRYFMSHKEKVIFSQKFGKYLWAEFGVVLIMAILSELVRKHFFVLFFVYASIFFMIASLWVQWKYVFVSDSEDTIKLNELKPLSDIIEFFIKFSLIGTLVYMLLLIVIIVYYKAAYD